MSEESRREAARAMGQAKTPAKKAAARDNVAKARAALTPEQIEARNEKVRAAQKARWERYRISQEATLKNTARKLSEATGREVTVEKLEADIARHAQKEREDGE